MGYRFLGGGCPVAKKKIVNTPGEKNMWLYDCFQKGVKQERIFSSDIHFLLAPDNNTCVRSSLLPDSGTTNVKIFLPKICQTTTQSCPKSIEKTHYFLVIYHEKQFSFQNILSNQILASKFL